MMSKNEMKANHNQCRCKSCTSSLANMMSKNEMKANHNSADVQNQDGIVGKYDVKERDESKSQPTGLHGATRMELANMMSKNEMKANHNTVRN